MFKGFTNRHLGKQSQQKINQNIQKEQQQNTNHTEKQITQFSDEDQQFQYIIVNEDGPISNQNRKKVLQPFRKHPYKYIGKLLTYFTQDQDINSSLQGTAFIIGRGILLTVAHNIDSTNDQKPPKKIYFYPVHQNAHPIRLKIKNYKKPKQYRNSLNLKASPNLYDIALLQIDQIDLNLHKKIMPEGYLRLKYNFQYTGADKVNILAAGFPNNTNGDPDACYLYEETAQLNKQDNCYLYYNHTTAGGQSGMPLFEITKDNTFNVIGFHKGKATPKAKAQGNKKKSNSNNLQQKSFVFGLFFRSQIQQKIYSMIIQMKKQHKLEQNFKLLQLSLKNKNIIKQLTHQDLLLNSLEEPVTIRFSQHAPEWRIVKSGLNLEGTCVKENCRAINQRVWVQKGFGIFFLNKEAVISKCPICKEKIKDIVNLGIYSCSMKVNGVTRQGQQFQKIYENLPEDHIFLTFQDKNETKMNWKYIELNVKENGWNWQRQ